MSGYCSAGKCECDAYFVSYNEHGKTEACGVSVIDLSKYEVCPWPSRQQIVEPPTDRPYDPTDPLDVAQKMAYEKGYAECKRQAVATLTAIPGVWVKSRGNCWLMDQFEAISIIESLVPNEQAAIKAQEDEMTNEQIAKVMGWDKIGSMIYIKCENRYVAVEFLEDIFLSELPAAKLLQAKMESDGWAIRIEFMPKQFNEPYTIRIDAWNGLWYRIETKEPEPAAIVSLFKKVYGGGR